MEAIADFHIHSRFAMACSKNITLPGLDAGARQKGISIIGTGDFTHPAWLAEIKNELVPAEQGLFKLRNSGTGTRFVLSTEVCTVFESGGKSKKIHNCILAPTLEVADEINLSLSKFGDLRSDGRPLLTMSAAQLVEALMGISKEIFVFPAHTWTPWFGVFGAFSGFDSMEEAYEDQAKHIYALETGLSCYDGETEVLTEDGWKKFPSLRYTDKICTLNQRTSEIEFQEPKRITASQYRGKMYKLKTKRIDLLVTPNHKLFWAPFASHKPIKFNLSEAKSLFGRSKTFKKDGLWTGQNKKCFELPAVKIRHGSRYYSGARDKKCKSLLIEPWLKFFGFWIAEGHTSNDGNRGSYAVVLSNTNKKIMDEMKTLLEKMDYNPYLSYNKNTKCYQLRVRDFQLFDYLSQFGKSYQKFIPPEIKSLSNNLLTIFFRYYIIGDGHIYGRTKKGLSATTNSIRLRDDLQEIALKMGMSAYYKLGSPKGTPLKSLNKAQYKSTHDAWVVYFIRRNLHSVVPSTLKKYGYTEKWVDFDGPVHCVTVKNHIVYIRRNSIPIWCGNSDPDMNWRISKLDKYALLSNSDPHSIPKIGREANVFDFDDGALAYDSIIKAIKEKDKKHFKMTIEFYPEEGKYHYDGHRGCDVSLSPQESKKYNGRCPVCGKRLTIGVEHRVEELADRPQGYKPKDAIPFVHVVPLIEVLSYVTRKGDKSMHVQGLYTKLIEKFGSEFNVTMKADIEQIKGVDRELAQAIEKIRTGDVNLIPGYDGVFGTVDIMKRIKPKPKGRQASLI